MPASPLIKTIREFPLRNSRKRHAFLLCGFGGSIWQLRRLIKLLHRQGYDVTAMDFSEIVLSRGDPALLPQLVAEVTGIIEQRAKHMDHAPLLVGVSLGALLSLNVLRRSSYVHRGVFITGGDIVKVAQRLYGPQVWPQSYHQLAALWQDINMYSQPAALSGKRAIMILPTKDKLIDPDDVRSEIAAQQKAGNNIHLVERQSFGHVGTIIEEAILFPHRTARYIRHVSQSDKKVASSLTQ